MSKERWNKKDYETLENLKNKVRVILYYSNYKLNIENLNFNLNNQTFTEDKKHVNMCIKDKQGYYYDENMLIFAFLHEVAHVLCEDYKDHSLSFKYIFNKLVNTAQRLGYYDKNIKKPEFYCGVKNQT